MFWPDDEALRELDWWTQPAWLDGPAFGTLVEALRPALRAALLLGWQVDAIEVSHGQHDAGSTAWASIDLATLELDPARELDDERPFAGPNIRLGAYEIADLLGTVEGTYAIPFELPVLGTDQLESSESAPAEVVDQVSALVEDAIAELAPRVAPDAAPAREPAGGLLWMLDPAHWRGLDAAALDALAPVTAELLAYPEDFLRGQLHGDRTQHVGPHVEPEPGPANLFFLQQRGAARPAHAGFWRSLGASLQSRGEAHRLPERARFRLASAKRAPTWLDALSELVWRGVVLVDGLVEPSDAVEPVEICSSVEDADGTLTEITLSVWGGDEHIVIRRELVFDDQPNAGLDGSVAWDYAPGDEQTQPTVIVVAGRGVALEHGWAEVHRRPWRLEVVRVQDDALVPTRGAAIDASTVLSPSLIESGVEVSFGQGPALLVKPKPDGVLLQFPASGTNGPATAPVSTVDIPRVIELTVDPASGSAAYALDVHFYAYTYGSYVLGGAHVCVWATPGVTIETSDSPTFEERGDPSALTEGFWESAWQYSAELWEATPARKLPRPWTAVLALTESAALRDDLLPSVPRLAYGGGRASSGAVTLVPAAHVYKQYGYRDTLAFTLFDIVLSTLPFVGDVADVGEALWAWQTGRDKWGRPVSDLELALMLVGAGVPLVSSGLLREVSELIGGSTVDEVPLAELGRLAVPAEWADDFPLEQVEAARGVSELLQPGPVVSAQRRAQAEEVIRAVAAADAAVDAPIGALARRLVGDDPAGWLTVEDVLADSGDAFSLAPLQTAYVRYLRDNPGATEGPAEWVDLVIGGGG